MMQLKESRIRSISLVAFLVLAACAAVPPAGPGTRTVAFHRIEAGYGVDFAKPTAFLVKDAATWRTVWELSNQSTPMPPPPPVDFRRNIILFVAMGEVGSGGHSIRVTSVHETRDGLVVDVLRRTPRRCRVSENMPHPVDAVVIKRSNRPVRWSFRDEVYDCPGVG